jgi:hypothetical protein
LRNVIVFFDDTLDWTMKVLKILLPNENVCGIFLPGRYDYNRGAMLDRAQID